MTPTSHLDVMFQVTASLFDRSPTALELDRSNQPAFGDHLAQASGTAQSDTPGSSSRENGSLAPTPSSESVQPTASTSATAGPPADDSSTSTLNDDTCDPNASSATCGTPDTRNPSDQTPKEPAIAESKGEVAAESDADGGSESDADASAEDNPLESALVIGVPNQVLDGNGVGGLLGADPAADQEQHLADGAAESSDTAGTASNLSNETASDIDGKVAGENAATDATHSQLSVKTGVQSALAGTADAQSAQQLQHATAVATHLKPTPANGAVGSSEAATHGHAGSRKSSRQRKTNEQPTAATTAHETGAVNAVVSRKTVNVEPATRRGSDRMKASVDSRRRTADRAENGGATGTEAAATANKAANIAAVNSAGTTASSDSAVVGDGKSPRAMAGSIAKHSDTLSHALARSHRTHDGSGRASRTTRTGATPHVDATRFVGRVAKAVQTAQERGGALQLRLSPPELGALRLQLVVENGVMTASLETENATARQVLLDHLPALRDRLAEQNIRIERFDVDVRQEHASGHGDARNPQHDQREQQPLHTPSRNSPRTRPADDAVRTPAVATVRPNVGGLNVLA